MDSLNKMPKNKLMKFIVCLAIFVQMYRYGFYFSKLTSKDLDGMRWGFYRLNFEKFGFSKYSLMDIDFQFGPAEDRKKFFRAQADKDFYWEKPDESS